MAEFDPEQDNPENHSARSRFMLPALVGLTISIIIGIFFFGYVNLTAPPLKHDDIYDLVEKKKQERESAEGDGSIDDSTEADDSEDGVFDFAKHQYFSFPLPFVVNFLDGNGMLTVEIAIATFETTLRGEKLIEKLTTFSPKMRSSINLVLAEQIYENLNTVAKRRTLEENLLESIRLVIDGASPDDPSGITDLHFTKFVISGTR
jgi:flagellar basal body-associated protein FliL